MTLREKMIFLREQAGLSQVELAEKVGLSRQAVSRWESGENVPSRENMKALAAVYHVSTDWLYNDGAGIEEVEKQEKPPAENLQPLPAQTQRRRLAGRKKILLGIAAALLLAILSIWILRWRETAAYRNVNETYVTQVEIPEDDGFDLNWEK